LATKLATLLQNYVSRNIAKSNRNLLCCQAISMVAQIIRTNYLVTRKQKNKKAIALISKHPK